jgi:ATP-binding cassette subfamily B (MDR/TAP) protein 1
MQMFPSRPQVGFYDKPENAIGTLTTKLSDDSRLIYRATGEAVAKQLQAVCTFLVALVIGFLAAWKIALVVLATFPVTIISSSIQMQALTGEKYDHEKSGSDHGAIISTAFNSMRTVCSYSLQYKISGQYAELTKAVAEDRKGRSLQAGVGFGASQMTMFCTYALLFWYGSTLIKSGEINFEQLMTAMMALMLGAFGLGTALGDVADQAQGLEAAKRVFTAIDAAKLSPTDGLSATGTVPAHRCAGKIEFRNVTFAYPSRKKINVCKDYCLTIEAGETVAFVGASGGGKSTIMNLLLRFYDPDSGSILLDGVDIKDLNVRWVRSQLGYVGQEPVLFSGSVEENIDMGNSSEEELLKHFADLVAIKNSDFLCGTCSPECLGREGGRGPGAAGNSSAFQSIDDAAEAGALTSEGDAAAAAAAVIATTTLLKYDYYCTCYLHCKRYVFCI